MASIKSLFNKLLEKNILLADSFNICLVLAKLRPACLIERDNHPTKRAFNKYVGKIQKTIKNLGLKTSETAWGVFIYTGRRKSRSISTNKKVGEILGFRCPDETGHTVALTVALSGDPDDGDTFYAEGCNNEIEVDYYQNWLAEIKDFVEREQLPLTLSMDIGRDFTVQELVAVLNSRRPVSENILYAVLNVLGNSGLNISMDIAASILQEDKKNYRALIKKYIPVWIVLLFYCENYPTYELFKEYINKKIVDVTWDDVDALHEKWELSVYEAFGLAR